MEGSSNRDDASVILSDRECLRASLPAGGQSLHDSLSAMNARRHQAGRERGQRWPKWAEEGGEPPPHKTDRGAKHKKAWEMPALGGPWPFWALDPSDRPPPEELRHYDVEPLNARFSAARPHLFVPAPADSLVPVHPERPPPPIAMATARIDEVARGEELRLPFVRGKLGAYWQALHNVGQLTPAEDPPLVLAWRLQNPLAAISSVEAEEDRKRHRTPPREPFKDTCGMHCDHSHFPPAGGGGGA